jgi:MinD superfamily P-loop ATPase
MCADKSTGLHCTITRLEGGGGRGGVNKCRRPEIMSHVTARCVGVHTPRTMIGMSSSWVATRNAGTIPDSRLMAMKPHAARSSAQLHIIDAASGATASVGSAIITADLAPMSRMLALPSPISGTVSE